MIEQQQELLARILNLFAERFDKHAVLRGGMVLRLLGCERLTNVLDYVFIPFASKKDVVDDVLDALSTLEGASLKHSLNSKCLRVVVTQGGVSVQVEIKVAMEVPTDMLSTRSVGEPYDLPPRLIPVVRYDTALADKMAAWNERRLLRDLYDIWFFLRMGVRPDVDTLRRRLSRPAYSKRVPVGDRLQDSGPEAFFEFLRARTAALTDEDLAGELSDYLKPEDLVGLSMLIRAEVAKLR